MRLACIALLLAPSLGVALPSYLHPTDHHAWAQNAGWVNAQPLGYTDDGVQVSRLTVSGIAWGQNMGWVQFGDGTPSNGLRYSNTSATDCGVNITDWRGNLSGYAWAQNAGWINFGWASASDANRPRYNFTTHAFEGYAWAQNLGWVNLGAGLLRNNSVSPWQDGDSDGLPDLWETQQTANTTTWNDSTDSDGDGLADSWEFLHFASLESSDGSLDSDGDGWADRVEYNARNASFAVSPVRNDQPVAWPAPPANSSISSGANYAWAQNLGWLNGLPDQPAGAGIYVTQLHLRGSAWLQNAGWISFGDGTPNDGLRYSNTTGADIGVNLDCDLNLSGYAWAQNIGWINFGWASPSHADRPRIVGSQFAGYAWAQNAGWIRLSALGNQFIGTFADGDSDGLPDHWEYQRVIHLGLLDANADTDQDGLRDAWEFAHFRALNISDGSGDFDQDTITDSEEHLAQSNPRNPLSLPPPTGSTIAATGKYAWAQNAGWINARHDRPQAPSGVIVREHFLSGKAWGQNIGWINFGDDTPSNGIRYSNTAGGDCGVNHDTGGTLSGYAWAQNAGWINVGWAAPTHPDRARIDLTTGQFKGFAWGQNIGWIHLSNGIVTERIDLADADQDGLDDGWEREHFGNTTLANSMTDADQDGQTDAQEFTSGTDPDDANSAFRITANTINPERVLASVTFTSHPSRIYRLRSSPDLIHWTPSALGWFSGFPASTQAFELLPGPQPRYFFNVEAKRPLAP